MEHHLSRTHRGRFPVGKAVTVLVAALIVALGAWIYSGMDRTASLSEVRKELSLSIERQ